MRKLSYVFVSILLLTVASCSKSDDTEPAQQQQQQQQQGDPDPDPTILGTWTGTAVSFTIDSVTTFPDGSTFDQFGEGVGSNYDFTVTYSENPNISTTEGNYDFEFTQVINGQTVVQNYEDVSFVNFTGAWELDGDQLSLSNNNSSGVGTISVLTANTLTYNYVFTEEFMQGNNTVTNLVNNQFSFTR